MHVLGAAEGMPVAEHLHLAAQFVVGQSGGKLEVLSSSAWTEREEVLGE
ncbi:MAG: hypothetical protein GWO24_01710 [Akkermansiaceae bacterium]|nr:hypothetical protein [Akkermansiaceae bacterium]